MPQERSIKSSFTEWSLSRFIREVMGGGGGVPQKGKRRQNFSLKI